MVSKYEDFNRLASMLTRLGLSPRKVAEVQGMAIDAIDTPMHNLVYARMFPDLGNWEEVPRKEMLVECGFTALKNAERSPGKEVASRCETALYKAVRAGENVP